ncbi:hypothetical protein CLOHYLEM_04617 [[Clostridium] hylemonae DSM 15053]|uniref:Uncharacterized protein n=1 Tax=[Clostridium] hylemonae DSM 15053 TaxID=553973 RepID=C0BXT0_9FIRM|nr:hypothetical protein CLOHYLEM_04617 [[Clostridium] hylemonae DSM 15053]QEK17099.1 hypothetical protein LAJLEIBI_01108 [[Clostridium] hylemonae DSM 15053]
MVALSIAFFHPGFHKIPSAVYCCYFVRDLLYFNIYVCEQLENLKSISADEEK